MRRIVCVFCVIVLSWTLYSQERDSLLRQINLIKKSPDRYLYGLSTIPGESDSMVSMEEARKELNNLAESYVQSEDFVFLKEKKEIPAHLTESISCLLRPDCYRSIVYVEIDRLRAFEDSLAQQLGNSARLEAMQQLIDGIVSAPTIDDVLNLIAGSSLVNEIRASQKIDDQTQSYANDALLVFFDPKSKKVLEVMTPLDESFTRKNIRTGAASNPMKYRNAPLWVYIEGLKNSTVL